MSVKLLYASWLWPFVFASRAVTLYESSQLTSLESLQIIISLHIEHSRHIVLGRYFHYEIPQTKQIPSDGKSLELNCDADPPTRKHFTRLPRTSSFAFNPVILWRQQIFLEWSSLRWELSSVSGVQMSLDWSWGFGVDVKYYQASRKCFVTSHGK